MKLYYTGGIRDNRVSSPDKSLGGYASSIEVQNGGHASLMTDMSYFKYSKKRNRVCVGFVLTNDSSTLLENVQIYVEKGDTSHFSYKIGIQEMSIDSLGNPFIGQIDSNEVLPNNVDLVDVSDDQAVLIEEFPPDSSVGLWLTRSLDLPPDDIFSCELDKGIDEEWSLVIE